MAHKKFTPCETKPEELLGVSFVVKNIPWPLSLDDQQFFLEHRLFAEGYDFTDLVPGAQGKSLLKNIYTAQNPIFGMENLCALTVALAMREGAPIAVAALFHPKTPEHMRVPENLANSNWKPKRALDICYLGTLMTYTQKEYRKRGVMKQAIKHLDTYMKPLARKAKKQGFIPILSAVGATIKLLKPTTLPVVSAISFCQTNKQSFVFRGDVWKHYSNSLFFDNRPEDKWVTSPVSIVPVAAPKRSLKKI